MVQGSRCFNKKARHLILVFESYLLYIRNLLTTVHKSRKKHEPNAFQAQTNSARLGTQVTARVFLNKNITKANFLRPDSRSQSVKKHVSTDLKCLEKNNKS
jgi:hypothetical protein